MISATSSTSHQEQAHTTPNKQIPGSIGIIRFKQLYIRSGNHCVTLLLNLLLNVFTTIFVPVCVSNNRHKKGVFDNLFNFKRKIFIGLLQATGTDGREWPFARLNFLVVAAMATFSYQMSL
jgi:hypothetical protein